jgi:predicted nucleic acid-binding protein
VNSAIARVVDASVVAAILFAEPEMDEALRLVEGYALIAPDLLAYEIVNVAIKKSRRHPESRDHIQAALSKFESLGIKLIDVEPSPVYQTADMSGLTGYDAAYLWLSQVKQTELVTFDKRLLQAASAP